VNGVGFSRATGSCQEYRAAMLDGIESGGLFGIKRHPVLVFVGRCLGLLVKFTLYSEGNTTLLKINLYLIRSK